MDLCSLLCRSTGRTPHSLFLGFPRRSPFMGNPAVSDNSPQSCENGLAACRADVLLSRAIHNKDEALVEPVVMQEVMSPHVVRVLHPSGLICNKDEALVKPVVIQEVMSPHVVRVLHPSGLYTQQG